MVPQEPHYLMVFLRLVHCHQIVIRPKANIYPGMVDEYFTTVHDLGSRRISRLEDMVAVPSNVYSGGMHSAANIIVRVRSKLQSNYWSVKHRSTASNPYSTVFSA